MDKEEYKSVKITEYEKVIIEVMIDECCSLATAMEIVFDMNGVDKKSVVDTVEYLEEQLKDLDKVEWFMDIYVGRKPNMILKVI
jgi:site-specific recombinase